MGVIIPGYGYGFIGRAAVLYDVLDGYFLLGLDGSAGIGQGDGAVEGGGYDGEWQ